VAGTETRHHHGSHRSLLWSPSAAPSAGQGVDAIIVPTCRVPAHLDEAAGLARELGAVLVTLHSGKWTTAAGAAQRLRGTDLIAIDVPDASRLSLPEFQASRLIEGTVFARRTDLSLKRNLALKLSHLAGWSRIMFLDDDITQLDPAGIRRAAGLLDTYYAVGLQLDGFPDHSVVCHAYRQAGGQQQSFVGGGALAVELTRSKSFFPDIYNDDWFFLLDGDKWLAPTAMTGRAVQAAYDPFRSPGRARDEELGDVLAEGIYWLLDQDRSIADADQSHWGSFLVRRGQFITQVLRLVEADASLGPAERARRIAALKGSLGRLALITPAFCERYLRAWMADRQHWRRHVDLLPAHLPTGSALAALSRRGTPPLHWETGDRQPARS
jgi:hypothetical protein